MFGALYHNKIPLEKSERKRTFSFRLCQTSRAMTALIDAPYIPKRQAFEVKSVSVDHLLALIYCSDMTFCSEAKSDLCKSFPSA